MDAIEQITHTTFIYNYVIQIHLCIPTISISFCILQDQLDKLNWIGFFDAVNRFFFFLLLFTELIIFWDRASLLSIVLVIEMKT